jgi:hypothetical protein
MKIDEINSMSLDDLWSLHEKLNSVLSRRLPEEKKRLERRIQQLKGAHASFTHTRRPYPACRPNIGIRTGLHRLGLAVWEAATLDSCSASVRQEVGRFSDSTPNSHGDSLCRRTLHAETKTRRHGAADLGRETSGVSNSMVGQACRAVSGIIQNQLKGTMLLRQSTMCCTRWRPRGVTSA